ncbi:homoserine dehydrogenase [Caldalkalibacillus uzonensis]|uniref:Homoserine dehydrogenase n=1 Tax=Caldalkalibacillus uzonensis TaxID=353224 RepID=A0ABU0CT28_9BACI|nr:homoserine dehydrogenase [Caldalkalibacillus uzonensis]MDQ0339577.1 homoserine dehydrogenase [Caldalkalibacillus uzonensis]
MLRIGLLGLGTVGSGVYEAISTEKERLTRLLGDEVEVVSILIKNSRKERPHVPRELLVTDFKSFVACKPDVVFEAIVGVDPAYFYVSYLLENSIPVISANKELIAKRGHRLEQIARQAGTYLSYEASVAGGIPILSALKTSLLFNQISQLQGILNGTTNYILTKMSQEGKPFSDVLHEAQALGYAEADPTADIEGWDALYKLQILAYYVTGTWEYSATLTCRGITGVEPWHMEVAGQLGLTLKLAALLTKTARGVEGRVEPVFLPAEHPLSQVNGVTNAIMVTGDLVGQLVFQGPGAGKKPTASAMLEDLVFCHRQFKAGYVPSNNVSLIPFEENDAQQSNRADENQPSLHNTSDYIIAFWRQSKGQQGLERLIKNCQGEWLYCEETEQLGTGLLKLNPNWREAISLCQEATLYPVLINEDDWQSSTLSSRLRSALRYVGSHPAYA